MASEGRRSQITFVGKSGTRYGFEALPLDAAAGRTEAGIYVITRRECLDRTFPTKASHRWLAIGRTRDFSRLPLAKADLKLLVAQGANCLCLHPVSEAHQIEIENDLFDGTAQPSTVSYLTRVEVPPRPPGQAHVEPAAATSASGKGRLKSVQREHG